MSLECPYCKEKLKNGYVSIHGTLGGFLLFGLSHQNLYFKTESEKEIKILNSNVTTPSMRCENCGVVILNKQIVQQSKKEILIEIFTISSSKELQESIKESNPGINIYDRIEITWKEFYFPENNEFMKVFTEKELKILSEFNSLIASKDWGKIALYADKNLGLLVNK